MNTQCHLRHHPVGQADELARSAARLFLSERLIFQGRSFCLNQRPDRLKSDHGRMTGDVRLLDQGIVFANHTPIIIAWFRHDLDSSAAFLDRALARNPNLAAAWNLSG